MAIMQVTSKEINLNTHKVTLKLSDTGYDYPIKLVAANVGNTLENVETLDVVDESLLNDIKVKQENSKTGFDNLVSNIENYSASWSYNSVPTPLATPQFAYSALQNSAIDENSPIDNTLKNNIIQNELYFSEKRGQIRNSLDWLIEQHGIRVTNQALELIANLNTLGGLYDTYTASGRTKYITCLAMRCADGDNGDYKYLRSPYITAYNGTNGGYVTVESGAYYEFISGDAEPKDPTRTYSGISTGIEQFTIAGTAGTKYRIKASFCVGANLITDSIFEVGVSKGATPTYGTGTAQWGLDTENRKIYSNDTNVKYSISLTDPTITLGTTGLTMSVYADPAAEMWLKNGTDSSVLKLVMPFGTNSGTIGRIRMIFLYDNSTPTLKPYIRYESISNYTSGSTLFTDLIEFSSDGSTTDWGYTDFATPFWGTIITASNVTVNLSDIKLAYPER